MPTLSGIYDSEPVQPVARIKENLSVFSAGAWQHYNIQFIEPMPRSSSMTVDIALLANPAVGGLVANGTIQQQLLTILRLSETDKLHEFLQVRFEPIDDIECILWEVNSQGRFAARAVTARVTRFTSVRDPWMATTTFFILGKDRDAFLEVRNPNPVRVPQCRVAFWGYRYMLEQLAQQPATSTYLPAEGVR